MTLKSTIALIRLLMGLRDLFEAALKLLIEKQNAEDLAVIEQEILAYSKGKTIEEKSEAAEKIKRMFNSHSSR